MHLFPNTNEMRKCWNDTSFLCFSEKLRIASVGGGPSEYLYQEDLVSPSTKVKKHFKFCFINPVSSFTSPCLI